MKNQNGSRLQREKVGAGLGSQGLVKRGGPMGWCGFWWNETIGCCLREANLHGHNLGRRFEEDAMTGSWGFTLFVQGTLLGGRLWNLLTFLSPTEV